MVLLKQVFVVLPVQVVSVQIQFIRVLKIKKVFLKLLWMTLLLVALNCLVFFGWQLPEERAVNKAAAAYAKTPLAAIELPQFVQHLQNQAR